MRLLALALFLAPLPVLAQAQAFFDADGAPLPWPAPRVYAAPLRLVTDTVRVEGAPGVVVYAEGADGERGTIIAPTRRAPVRVVHGNGWVELTQGCGPGCALSTFVDGPRGRVAGPLALVLDVDTVGDRVVAAGADGLVVLDPFLPEGAREVPLPLDLTPFGSPARGLRRVAFVLGEDALAVTVPGENGEEETVVVPLDE